jgi:hypothetical protein
MTGQAEKGGHMKEMGNISTDELKLLLRFVKDNLEEAKEIEDAEKKNVKIEKALNNIQSYLED